MGVGGLGVGMGGMRRERGEIRRKRGCDTHAGGGEDSPAKHAHSDAARAVEAGGGTPRPPGLAPAHLGGGAPYSMQRMGQVGGTGWFSGDSDQTEGKGRVLWSAGGPCRARGRDQSDQGPSHGELAQASYSGVGPGVRRRDAGAKHEYGPTQVEDFYLRSFPGAGPTTTTPPAPLSGSPKAAAATAAAAASETLRASESTSTPSTPGSGGAVAARHSDSSMPSAPETAPPFVPDAAPPLVARAASCTPPVSPPATALPPSPPSPPLSLHRPQADLDAAAAPPGAAAASGSVDPATPE